MTKVCALIVTLLLLHGAAAFRQVARQNFASRPTTLVPLRVSPQKCCSFTRRTRSSLVWMATTEEQLDEDKSSVAPSASENEQDDTTSGGLTRTILLAVPLFCKFVIVLCIKFLTDAVVFPLLFLYRLARITKRKIRALFSKKDGTSPPNGEQPPGTNNKVAP